MKSPLGTPKNLLEAVEHIFIQVTEKNYTSLNEDKDNARMVIRDYLAHKFQSAIGRAENIEEQEKLMALFKHIVGE